VFSTFYILQAKPPKRHEPGVTYPTTHLENRDLDRQNLRSMLKFSYAACPCLSQLVSAQFALAMCLAARNRQKIHNTPYFSVQSHSRSMGAYREPVYDLLLMINSNLGHISHRY